MRIVRRPPDHDDMERRAGRPQRRQHLLVEAIAQLGSFRRDGDHDRPRRAALRDPLTGLDDGVEQIRAAVRARKNPLDALHKRTAIGGVVGGDGRPLGHGDDRDLVPRPGPIAARQRVDEGCQCLAIVADERRCRLTVVDENRDLHRLDRRRHGQHFTGDVVLANRDIRGSEIGDGSARLVERAHIERTSVRLRVQPGCRSEEGEHENGGGETPIHHQTSIGLGFEKRQAVLTQNRFEICKLREMHRHAPVS